MNKPYFFRDDYSGEVECFESEAERNLALMEYIKGYDDPTEAYDVITCINIGVLTHSIKAIDIPKEELHLWNVSDDEDNPFTWEIMPYE